MRRPSEEDGFEETWPAYERWFLKEGEDARPSYPMSVRMLRAHKCRNWSDPRAIL